MLNPFQPAIDAVEAKLHAWGTKALTDAETKARAWADEELRKTKVWLIKKAIVHGYEDLAELDPDHADGWLAAAKTIGQG